MITNLGTLKVAIANRAHRADLASDIPEFIQLGEKKINRDLLTDYDLANGADTSSNELLDNAPDLYLFAALAQLAIATHDADKLAEWGALYTTLVEDAKYYEFVASGEGDQVARMDDLLGGGRSNILTGR